MIKRVLLLSCLIGVTASLPAYASPTKKTITVTCSSVNPDTIYGSATVVLGDGKGNTETCSMIDCNNSGSPGIPAVNSTECLTSFKTAEITLFSLYYQDSNGMSDPTSAGPVPLSGRGFTFQDGAGGTGDTVTLTVK